MHRIPPLPRVHIPIRSTIRLVAAGAGWGGGDDAALEEKGVQGRRCRNEDVMNTAVSKEAEGGGERTTCTRFQVFPQVEGK